MEWKSGACLRADARALLAKNGNRLLLIEAQSILLLALAAMLFLDYTLSLVLLLFSEANWAVDVLETVYIAVRLVIWGAFLLPLGFGLFYMAKRMVEGRSCTLLDLFFAFRSRHAFVRAVWGTQDAFFILALASLALQVTDELAPSLLADPRVLALALLLSLLFFVLLSSFSYTRVYDALCDFDLVRPTPWRRACRAWRLWGAYLPRILLGFLTVGLTLIADAIPQMLLAQAIDCADACTPVDCDVSEDEYTSFSCDK